jgi:hypothetical protein
MSKTMILKNKNFSALLGPILLIVINLFIIGPFTLFLGNIGEFRFPLSQLIVFFILAAIILLLVLVTIGILLPNNQRYISILLSLGVLIWFQGNILVWKYGLMDGQGINWQHNVWRGWLDGALWVLLILAAVIFYKPIFKIAKFLSLLLLSFQLLLMGVQSFQTPKVWLSKSKSRLGTPPPQAIFDFSRKQNVILIILDGFQTDIFEEIIQENQEYNSILQGFVFFKNTSGAFPTTKMSLPAILSGKLYKNQTNMTRYIRKQMRRKTIHRVLIKAGFEVDLVCGRMYRGSRNHFTNYYRVIRPYGVSKSKFLLSNSTLVFDLVLFRHVPHFLKRVIYNDQAWFTHGLVNREEISTFHYLGSRNFFNDFMKNISNTREKPVYKLIHLMHPHPPIVVDKDCKFCDKVLPTTRENLKNQGRCGLNQVVEFLNQLKSMQIYDSSLIIIQADHGAGIPPRSEDSDTPRTADFKKNNKKLLSIMGSAASLMLIKKPFSHGEMTTSTVPASLTDMPATLCHLLNLGKRFPGKSIFKLKPGEKRKRYYHYHPWKHQNWKDKFFESLEEYIIEGSIFNPKSWKKGQTFQPGMLLDKKSKTEKIKSDDRL